MKRERYKLAHICLFCFLCSVKVCAGTNVNGDVWGHWTSAGSPYTLAATVTVPVGETLIIDPGVEVQFPESVSHTSQLIVKGTLTAVGTSANSIKFTGGAIYGAYLADTWRGPVTIDTTSRNSILSFIQFDGLGYQASSDYTAALIVNSSSCTVSNCNILNTKGIGILLNSGGATLSNNLFSKDSLDIITMPDRLVQISGTMALKIGLLAGTFTSNNLLRNTHTFYRLLGNDTVPTGKTLTIEPGTEIQFSESVSHTSQLIVKGTLTAVGTPDNLIKFTGGPIYGAYLADSWRGPVTIDTTSQNSVLTFVQFDGLGYQVNTDYTAALIINSSSCVVSNCNIINTKGTGVSLNSAGTTLSNNLFSKDSLDIITMPDRLVQISGTVSLKIGLLAGAFTFNNSLSASNLFYRLLGSDTVAINKTLSIEPGVEIQFPESVSHSSQLFVKGTLIAAGTSGKNIKLTGGPIYGAYLSDTWRGPITMESGSQNSVLKFVHIDGLGYQVSSASTPVLIIKTTSFMVTNCRFENNKGVAISLENTSSTAISNTCIMNNVAGVLSNGGNAVLSNCNFSNNSSFGVNNTASTATVDARNCYWGNASGPRNATSNPGGTGDMVSQNVLYVPWNSTQSDCSETILPLTLLNFKASLSKDRVNCSWQTASESNMSRFIIERSISGGNFSAIGQVNAAGYSNLNTSYSFEDNAPNQGVNYYRLKMVNIDAGYIYSKVLLVNILGKQALVVSPNPIKETLFIQLQRNKAEMVLVQITDIEGKVLYQESQQLPAGSTSLSFSTSSLSKGTYIVVIKGERVEAKRFIKE